VKELNVPFQIKLPADVVLALNVRYVKLREEYDAALALIEKKIKTGRGSEKLAAERHKLMEQARTLSLANMIRAAVVEGQSILKLRNPALLAKLAEDGLTRGRPRNAA
jgi:hypothetical protein